MSGGEHLARNELHSRSPRLTAAPLPLPSCPRLKRTLSRLAQHEVKATQPSAQVNEDEAAGATFANSEHSDNVSTPRPPLTIVVRLHPLDIQRIVQGPSIELRDPWASGVFLPSDVLRLLLWLEGRRRLNGGPQ